MSGAKWMSGSAAQTCAPLKRRNGNSLHSRFSAPPFSQPISFTARTAILAKSPRTIALGTTLRTVAAASTLALLAGCAAPADGGGAAPSSDASIEMVTVALPGSVSSLSVGRRTESSTTTSHPFRRRGLSPRLPTAIFSRAWPSPGGRPIHYLCLRAASGRKVPGRHPGHRRRCDLRSSKGQDRGHGLSRPQDAWLRRVSDREVTSTR